MASKFAKKLASDRATNRKKKTEHPKSSWSDVHPTLITFLIDLMTPDNIAVQFYPPHPEYNTLTFQLFEWSEDGNHFRENYTIRPTEDTNLAFYVHLESIAGAIGQTPPPYLEDLANDK